MEGLKDFNFWAVVAYVLPGLLMVQARWLAAKTRLAPISKESVVGFLVVTVLYTLALWGLGVAVQSPSSIYGLEPQTLLGYFVLAPLALGFVFGLLERNWLVQRLLIPFGINAPLPVASVWLEIFSGVPEGTYMIVVLKDGTIYNTMVTSESRFSSDPAKPDLYLGQTYSLPDWEPSDPQRGVFIPGSEIRSIEIVRGP